MCINKNESTRAKRKKKATTKKVSYKDKAWYEIIAPKSFNFKSIGEIIGIEKNIIGTINFVFINIPP